MELSEIQVQKAKEALVRKMNSKNASVLLDRLGRNKQFINAIETPAGREIVSIAVEILDSYVAKLTTPSLTEEQWGGLYKDYLELQAALKFQNKIISILNSYNKDRETFNKALGD